MVLDAIPLKYAPGKARVYNGESRGFPGGKSDFVTGKPFVLRQAQQPKKKGRFMAALDVGKLSLLLQEDKSFVSALQSLKALDIRAVGS